MILSFSCDLNNIIRYLLNIKPRQFLSPNKLLQDDVEITKNIGHMTVNRDSRKFTVIYNR
jgi:hypothetical protein